MKFNKRKFFHFGQNRKCISFEIAGFDSSPTIGLNVDGGEGDFVIHLAFGIGLWITFTDFLPNNWYPTDRSDTYGSLPGERDLSIRFHHWSLWWCFWKDNSRWCSGDSKLRSGSFDFVRLLKGKHDCKWIVLEKEIHTISMTEKDYSVEVTKELRIDFWQRWFTNKSISYKVKCGYYDESKKFIECPIPVEGKGENSWDCGENARYSSSFPAKNDNHNIKNCSEAALYFEQDINKDRIRYGGKNWIPKEYKREY